MAQVEASACGTMPKGVSLSRGSRARWSIGKELGVDEVLQVSATGDGDVWTDGDELFVRTPGSGEEITVTARVRCGAVEAEKNLAVSLRAPKWTPLFPWTDGHGPVAREYFAMWLAEPDAGSLWVYGGLAYRPKQFTPIFDLWKLDLDKGTWSEETAIGTAPSTSGGRVVNVPGRGEVQIFGGLANGSAVPTFAKLKYDPAPSWEPMPGATSSPGSYGGSIVYDVRRKRFVSLCGISNQRGLNCAVYTYDDAPNAEWKELSVAKGAKPKGRLGFFYGYDEETDRVIVFGGDTDNATWEGKMAEDTWALELGENPPRWVQIEESHEPKFGRRNGAWVTDPKEHRLLAWGGTADGQTTFSGLWSLSLDRGHERWMRLDTEGDAPERTSAAAVYDAKRSRAVFGFGNGARDYADLWALSSE